MGRVVGIDLGTTNSVVAVMEGGKPVVIANSEGMRTTPSVTGFNKDGELVVGQLARRQAVLNPENTFYGVKRFIGRQYAELQTESKRIPYTIRRDEIGNIKIRCPRLKKEFAPEEISAMILRKLAEEASRYLGEPVTGAVITVPAYFNDSQRQATKDAGRIAGLEVLRIINEPTAASLAYGLEKRKSETILVFDLGGGTFDVSILDVGEGVFEVKATSGDTQLGGNDFDKKIVDWLATEFQEKEGVDLRRDRQALQRLMEAAEKAKIELSGVSVTEINLPFITATPDGPKHIETQLSRAKFEELCGDLVSRLRRPIKRAFYDANLTPAQIDEVVLVGGATRMPMVKELVRSYINLEPNENVNPDEVVAVGAAIQSGILVGEVKDILLLDVTPLSLGIETIGGLMKKLIPRNTTIPVRRSDSFSTSENNQTMVEIQVLQGEREMALGNKSLGKFRLTGIPPAPRGMPQVQVSFDIDANGILQVTAVDKTTGRQQSLIIQGTSTLSEIEVNRMITEAAQFANEDRERRERVEKRNRAKTLTDQAQRKLKEVALDYGSQFANYYRRRIDSLCQVILDSLEKGDEVALDRAQADLQDALYELNREIRLQYESEEDEGFFASLRRTFSGDDDDDKYYSSRDYNRDDYRSPKPQDNYPSRSYQKDNRDDYRSYQNNNTQKDNQDDYPSRNYQRDNRDDYRSYQNNNTQRDNRDDYEPRKSSDSKARPRNYPPQSNPRYNDRGRSGNIPYENDWDEEDDEWF
ncbi:molecular chaperone DnaK [Gloeocapsa sp. PCC 73106]|uniref:molecular chaperone DnaK n=1 Tax=Gloeocapsa sp. PCC 73106 TaxID=102232 RepID=UPI0002ABA88B|nr:molecular chaperone DnaK [Gloeocapsa sp. PCC 73106]ELR96908.1 chaperone protein DnaK [Gloeocapsa sp. PCC 73106]